MHVDVRLAERSRNRGGPANSEFTVVKVDAYNGINAYLSRLSETSILTTEDVVAFNSKNAGTEGPKPGDIPAFPSGQVLVRDYPDRLIADEVGQS